MQADLQLDVDPGVADDGGPALGIAIRSESDVVHVRLDRVPDLASRPSAAAHPLRGRRPAGPGPEAWSSTARTAA